MEVRSATLHPARLKLPPAFMTGPDMNATSPPAPNIVGPQPKTVGKGACELLKVLRGRRKEFNDARNG